MAPLNSSSIQLKPLLGRSYLSGYPGIPFTNALTPRTPDTLTPLPLLARESACLSGSVEVRTNGKPLKAKWLRVELEKVEIIAAGTIALAGGDRGNGNGDTKRFVELIGIEPETLWSANSIGDRNFDGKKLNKNKEFAELAEGNYEFRIPLPEGLPPSIQVDGSGSGISYQLVATVYSKGKKSFFHSNPGVLYLTDQVPILLDKLDILPAWPIYSPILRPPPIKPLSWMSKNGTTTGELKMIEHSLRSARGEDGGKLRITCYRESGSFGPGDIVRVRIDLDLEGNNAVKLTRLELSLKETITLKYADFKVPVAKTTFFNPPAIVNKIFTVSPSSSTSISAGSFLAIIYPNETTSFDLSHTLSNSHSRVTVKTGKHLEIAYSLEIKGTVESGGEIGIENWSVIIGGANKKDSLGMIKQIGYVEELCERGETHGETNTGRNHNNLKILSPRTSPPARPPPRRTNSNQIKPQFNQSVPLSKEVAPVETEQHFENEKSPQLRQKFIIHNADVEPDVEDEVTSTNTIKAGSFTPPVKSIAISEAQQVPPPLVLESAASEKERLYSAAIRERDEVQKQRARQEALNSLVSRTNSVLAPPSSYSPSAVPASSGQVKEINESRQTLQEARFEILQRQEAARIELERQNNLLLALEQEESRQRQIDQDRAELEAYRRRDRESTQFGMTQGMQEVGYDKGSQNRGNNGIEAVSRTYSRMTPTAPPMDFNYDHYVEPLPAPTLSYPQPLDIKRSPSAASFAPSTGISQATSQFYATAIANSANNTQNPTLEDEKSNYLRTIRQRDYDSKKSFPNYPINNPYPYSSNQRNVSPLPTPPRSPPINFTTDQKLPLHYGASSADSYSYAPQQHQSQYNQENRYHNDIKDQQYHQQQQYPLHQETSTASTSLPLPGHYDSPSPAQATDTGYKSALEEKAELEKKTTEAEPEERGRESHDEDLLPVYETSRSGEKILSASEEKRELSTYYAAKAEVNAYRNRPSPPSPREEYHSTGDSNPQYVSKSTPTIMESNYQLQSSPEDIDQSFSSAPVQVQTGSRPEYFPPYPYPAPSAPFLPSSFILPSINESGHYQNHQQPTSYQNGNGNSSSPRGRRSDSILSESSTGTEIHRDPSIAAGKKVSRNASGQYQYGRPAINEDCERN